MALNKPELVLFDLDGTLIDTAPDLAFSIDETLKQLGMPECGETRVRAWIGSGIDGLLNRALTNDIKGKADKDLFERALTIFKEIYFENICRQSRIYAGVSEALTFLQTSNIAMACVTNKTARFTDKILQELDLYDQFGIVVSGDTLSVKKPRPEPLLHALAHYSLSPASALMVGDSRTDVNAARAAEVPVLCVTYGYNMNIDVRELKPDAVVDSLAELPKLIN
ncbi:MAG: phosphoglycolate phosphatase [Gammaproteobacteria bacterium]|nr:phosphoglycolate phosphatase [Gammaproteobacteria bacterium]